MGLAAAEEEEEGKEDGGGENESARKNRATAEVNVWRCHFSGGGGGFAKIRTTPGGMRPEEDVIFSLCHLP